MLTQLVHEAQGHTDPEPARQVLPAYRWAYRSALRAAQRTFEQEREFKKAKLHRDANNATQCLQVKPTGTKVEWGIEGRFRLINRCDYPVDASWGANTNACMEGHGSTWNLNPRVD